MEAGIRAVVRVDEVDGCPMASISEQRGERIEVVSILAAQPNNKSTTMECQIEGNLSDDPLTDEVVSIDSIEPVFEHGSTTRYRVTKATENNCPCTCLGALGCPIARYVAIDGSVLLEFCAKDAEELQMILETLRARFPTTMIKRLIQPATAHTEADIVMIDTKRLTARQREVIRTAHQMGYFERPRQANATEIADVLGIHPSTFAEHLATAQRKVFDVVLDQ